MIYDFLSQKTDDDVLKMDDIHEVREFRRSLEEQLSRLKIIKAKFGQLTNNQKVKMTALKSLIRTCNLRIKELALDSGKYNVKIKIKATEELKESRRLESAFMSVAKNMLDKELYNEILEKAKTEIEGK